MLRREWLDCMIYCKGLKHFYEGNFHGNEHGLQTQFQVVLSNYLVNPFTSKGMLKIYANQIIESNYFPSTQAQSLLETIKIFITKIKL